MEREAMSGRVGEIIERRGIDCLGNKIVFSSRIYVGG